MSDFLTLTAKKREKTGKGVARKLRVKGLVPAVFYTNNGESLPLEISAKELNKIYGQVGRTTVFNIEIEADGNKNVHPALFWDVDFFPTKNLIQHVDVFGVDLNKEIKLSVQLVFNGVAKGTKVGGKLEIYRESINISCKPLSLPKRIEIDINNLGVNDTLRISDLAMPEGVKAEYDTNYAIISVIMPGAATEENSAEEE